MCIKIKIKITQTTAGAVYQQPQVKAGGRPVHTPFGYCPLYAPSTIPIFIFQIKPLDLN